MLVRLRTMYGIRRVGTNEFMPNVKNGFTWCEPENMSVSKVGPRLFPSEKNAKTALTMWCKGGISKLPGEGKYTPETMVHPKGRSLEDYEVVKIVLQIEKGEDA